MSSSAPASCRRPAGGGPSCCEVSGAAPLARRAGGSAAATRWASSVAPGLARTSRSRSCSRALGRLRAVARRASSRPAWWRRDLGAVLEWLARYPGAPADDPPPPATEAVMVSGTADARLVEAVESARRRGARTRGWIVGEADVDLDAAVEHVGVGWPL